MATVVTELLTYPHRHSVQTYFTTTNFDTSRRLSTCLELHQFWKHGVALETRYPKRGD